MRHILVIAALLLALALAAGWVLRWRWLDWQTHQHDPLIQAAAAQHGLPPQLVKAVVWRESRFRASAIGSKGELGLMQVTGDAAQEWADARRDRGFRPGHLLHPGTNLLAGSYYLAKVARRYAATDVPHAFALADYNAGRANVLRWMKGPARTNAQAFIQSITFPGTREYVRAILQQAPSYQGDFPNPIASPTSDPPDLPRHGQSR